MTLYGASFNLASDPRVPQRDLLLNVDEVARRLASGLGANGTLSIDSCERIRTKYRFGESLRVLHRVSVGDAELTIAARTFPKGEGERAYKYERRHTIEKEGSFKSVAYDPELDTVFWTFPNDRKLYGLHALSGIPLRLAQVVVPGWTESRVVAYAPEKCATAECLNEDSNILAYAKVYQGDEGERVFNIYQSLKQSLSPVDEALRLPQAIAYSKAHRMLFLERIEGHHLADLEDADAALSGYRKLGAALATLHSLPLPEGLPSFKRLEVKRIRQAARIIGLARPDVLRRALDLADKLTALSELNSERPVCLHGDVHPKNGILSRGPLTLIDLDQAARGNAAADLGSFLASLSYNHLTGLFSQAETQELGDAFLRGYADLRRLPGEASLRWHMAAALLAERALRAVNRIRPEGLDGLARLISEANKILLSGAKRR